MRLKTQISTITQFIQWTFHQWGINQDKRTIHVNISHNHHIKSIKQHGDRNKSVQRKKERTWSIIMKLTKRKQDNKIQVHWMYQKKYHFQQTIFMTKLLVTKVCLSWVDLWRVFVGFSLLNRHPSRKIMMESDLSTLLASVSEAVVIWVSFCVCK